MLGKLSAGIILFVPDDCNVAPLARRVKWRARAVVTCVDNSSRRQKSAHCVFVSWLKWGVACLLHTYLHVFDVPSEARVYRISDKIQLLTERFMREEHSAERTKLFPFVWGLCEGR